MQANQTALSVADSKILMMAALTAVMEEAYAGGWTPSQQIALRLVNLANDPDIQQANVGCLLTPATVEAFLDRALASVGM